MSAPKLSTGADSTLGEYIKLTKALFGDGPALAFLEKKVAESPNGENEEVLAPESQMIPLLASMSA